jgi:hypothetical protein
VLHITTLHDQDTGVIEVIGKYGGRYIRSPYTSAKMMLDVQFAPRGISFTSNVTNSRVLENDQYVGLTCTARANPQPVYKVQKAIKVVYEGKKTKSVYYVSGIHEGRHAWFTCTAYNSLGMATTDLTLPLQLQSDEVVARSGFARADSSWLKYFIIGAVALLLIFIIVSFISFAIRRRMRSMNITDESQQQQQYPRRPSLKSNNYNPSSHNSNKSASHSVVTSTHEDYAAVARDLSNRQSTKTTGGGKNQGDPSTRYYGFTNEGMQRSQEFNDMAGPSTKF